MWILKTHKTQAIREMSLFTTTEVQFVKQTESGKCLNSSNKKNLSLHSDLRFMASGRSRNPDFYVLNKA